MGKSIRKDGKVQKCFDQKIWHFCGIKGDCMNIGFIILVELVMYCRRKRRNQFELYSLSHLIPSCLVSPPSYRNIGEPWSRILGWRRFFKIHLWLPIGDLLISGINSSEPEFQILHRMRSKRLIPGMKPCGLNCPTCPFIEPGTIL